MKLKVGSKAPDWNIPDQDGKLRSLKEFKGKKVVLYFYPQDSTPTCTEEACNLSDNYKRFLKEGYVVLGVSPDGQKKHQNFIKKYALPFSLLSDTELLVCNAYGVWGEKTTFGKTYMGVIRTTFIIDENGKIERIIDKVKAKNHTAQLLDGAE